MNKIFFLVFLAIVLLLYFGMNYYVYSRVAVGLALSPAAGYCVRLFFLVAAFSFFIGEFLNRETTSILIKPIAYFGGAWLGVLAMGVTIFVLSDLVRIFIPGTAFRYYTTIVSLIILLVVSAYALYNNARHPVFREISVPVKNLPEGRREFSVVQLSDLHLNFFKSTGWLNGVVDIVNNASPDLIVITGDIIDADLLRTNGFCEALLRLRSPHGVYAITGNHEFYAGVDKFIDIAKRSNIEVLRNRRVDIGGIIELAGIDDTDFANPLESLPLALGSRDTSKPMVFLSHRPDVFDEARKYGDILQLSGHTHAGQIPPADLIVKLGFKYPWGFFKQGMSHIYTNTGTGYWGPPMRLFSRSEVVKFVLTQE